MAVPRAGHQKAVSTAHNKSHEEPHTLWSHQTLESLALDLSLPAHIDSGGSNGGRLVVTAAGKCDMRPWGGWTDGSGRNRKSFRWATPRCQWDWGTREVHCSSEGC